MARSGYAGRPNQPSNSFSLDLSAFTQWVYAKTGLILTQQQLAQIEAYGVLEDVSLLEVSDLIKSYLEDKQRQQDLIPSLADAIGRCQSLGMRLSRQRFAILELLYDVQKPLSAHKICDELNRRGRKIGSTSTYQNLEALAEHRIIQRIDNTNEPLYGIRLGSEEADFNQELEKAAKESDAFLKQQRLESKRLDSALEVAIDQLETNIEELC